MDGYLEGDPVVFRPRLRGDGSISIDGTDPRMRMQTAKAGRCTITHSHGMAVPNTER